jgi:hypothetical protein
VYTILEEQGVTFDGNVAKTQTVKCPACEGGRHGDRSFMVWYDPRKIMYKCYRGKCGIGGSFRPDGSDVQVKSGAAIRSIYRGNMRRLNEEEKAWVTAKYDQLYLRDNLRINDNCGRLGVLLRDRWGHIWGVDLKNWCNIKDLPKSSRKYMTVKDTGNNLAWARNRSERGDDLFLTEDAISAYRIRGDTGQDAVALLGTHLRQQDAEVLLGMGYQRLRLVLDPDEAGIKGMQRIRNEYGFMFDISVHLLPDDPKDCTAKVLKDEVNYILGN